MGHALQTTSKSLDASILALKTSYNALSETMSAVHESIKENHLKQLPTHLIKDEKYEFIEGVDIEDKNYYSLYYSVLVTDARGWPSESVDYEISIALVKWGLKSEVNEDYKRLSKIEHSKYEKLLNKAYEHFEKYGTIEDYLPEEITGNY